MNQALHNSPPEPPAEPKLRMVRPLEERIQEKLRVGGFLYLRTEQDDHGETDVWGYAEAERPDVVKYELPVRAGEVLSCQCLWHEHHGHCAHMGALLQSLSDDPPPVVEATNERSEAWAAILRDPEARRRELARLAEAW